MKIRKLKPTEINTAAAIVRNNYNSRYERLAKIELREMFSKAPFRPTYLVAEERGAVLGFAGYMQSWMDYNIYTIFWVNVAPSQQRRGIGKALVAKIIAEIKRKKISTVLLTTSSPRYYSAHFGFKSVHRFNRGKYYLMLLSLEQSGCRT